MSKRILLILNPCSGKNKKRAGALDIIDKLSTENYDFNIKTTTCQGDATRIAVEYGNDYDTIICVGGDGTLNETVNGVLRLNKRVPVGYVPAGSTNDLASTLGIPVGASEATDLILSGKTNSYDAGKLNDRYFNYVACFGAATDISYNTPQSYKNLLGKNAYFINGFVIRLGTMLKNFRPNHVKVEYDDGEFEDDVFYLSLSNSTEVSAGLFKIPDVKLNDGIFELCVVRGLKKNIEALELIPKVMKKDYSDPRIDIVKTKHLKVTCDEEIAWCVDGELAGNFKNAELSVVHNAFDIYSDNDKLFD